MINDPNTMKRAVHTTLSEEHSTQEPSLIQIFSTELLVVGLVRNCGASVRNSINVIKKTLRHFRKVHWLVIESDSTDDTMDVLRSLEVDVSDFRFISLGMLKDQFPLRTARIAYCRNRYLEELANNPSYSAVDYLIVADLDGVNEKLTEEAFLSCWNREGWAGCMANQNGPYYDIYALRHNLWCPNDSLLQADFLAQYLEKDRASAIAVQSKMIRIPKNSAWIEVESAFGGMAIYRRTAIGDAKYQGLDEQGKETCEHISFHRAIRDNGFRLYINPKLINSDYTEHSLRFSMRAQLKRKSIAMLKKILAWNRMRYFT